MFSPKELTNLFVPVVLFILLTPGLLLTLPSTSSSKTEQTFTHAAVFLLAYATLRTVFKKFY
jgi:hypothetical protein